MINNDFTYSVEYTTEIHETYDNDERAKITFKFGKIKSSLPLPENSMGKAFSQTCIMTNRGKIQQVLSGERNITVTSISMFPEERITTGHEWNSSVTVITQGITVTFPLKVKLEKIHDYEREKCAFIKYSGENDDINIPAGQNSVRMKMTLTGSFNFNIEDGIVMSENGLVKYFIKSAEGFTPVGEFTMKNRIVR